MIIKEEDYIAHYGTPRKSGRYPWGSGGTDSQRNRSLLDYIDNMRKQGLTDSVIAKGLEMTRNELQAQRTLAKAAEKQADIIQAHRLKDTGMSTSAIGREMNRNESSVRSLLLPGQMAKTQRLMTMSNLIQEMVDEKKVLDVGPGVEYQFGVSRDQVDKALAILKEKGYYRTNVQVDQAGTTNKTNIKIIAVPGTTYRDIVKDKSVIKPVMNFSEDQGQSWSGIEPPLSIDQSRVKIRYAKDGGSEADGVVYVRRGVDDLSLGAGNFAQVRILVDGTHYIKGMAMYNDGLPKGIDLVFNTVKNDTGDKLDALKRLKADKDGVVDPANPFGSVVHQLTKENPDGTKTVLSAMNLVNEEADWAKWSKSLSSQMLSKQNPSLAKTQLDMTFEKKKQDLDEITALTNPAVRVKLLNSYADSADSSAVHLKAAALPRQATHVILPFSSMKDTEIYAPNFDNGERVALIRFPHGGIFEIPELIVNNKNPEAKKLLGNTTVAVGINAKVAERLSGADFDGDTVLVIPNGRGTIKTAPALEGLKNFDPKTAFPGYDGMVTMTEHAKGTHMGNISNLITDMTIQKAPAAELARAVRHSMVVIDAEKHGLNYKESARVNNIAQLKKKYQGGTIAGANTLISKAKSRIDVPDYKPGSTKNGGGGPIDKATGKLIFVPTNEGWTRTTVNKRTGVVTEQWVVKTKKSKKMVETQDAHTLSSGTKIEEIYANHANKLKHLANMARLEKVNTKPSHVQPSAKVAYAAEVTSLNSKLAEALTNSPFERHAQVLANTNIAAKKAANADMSNAELKKIKFMALETARARVGAKKKKIDITQNEWDAIQAGAITNHKLSQILDNTDLDQVKKLATPRVTVLMTASKRSQAIGMLARGYTQSEVAARMGVSVSTLIKSIE